MSRLLLSTVFASAFLVSMPAAAAHYRAEPTVAPMSDQIVLRDTVWQRNGAAFEAGKSNSRPAVVCAVLVKQVGELKSFSIGGAPIASADLEKCNARAAH